MVDIPQIDPLDKLHELISLSLVNKIYCYLILTNIVFTCLINLKLR